jgi:hypothetical protein
MPAQPKLPRAIEYRAAIEEQRRAVSERLMLARVNLEPVMSRAAKAIHASPHQWHKFERYGVAPDGRAIDEYSLVEFCIYYDAKARRDPHFPAEEGAPLLLWLLLGVPTYLNQSLRRGIQKSIAAAKRGGAASPERAQPAATRASPRREAHLEPAE